MTPKEALNKFNYIFELFLRNKCNEQFVSEIDKAYCVDTYVDKNNLFRELEKALDELEQAKKILEIFKRGYGRSENQFYTVEKLAYKDKTYSYYLNANYANWENDHMKLTKEEYKMLKKWLEVKE